MSDRNAVVDAGTSAESSEPPPKRRHSRARLAIVLVVVVIVLVVWATVDALLARSHLVRARDRLTAFAASGQVTSSAIQGKLTASLADAEAASSLLGQPASWLARHIPLAGRSWVAENTVAQTAQVVLKSLQPVLRDSSNLGSGQRVNLTSLAKLHQDLASASATLSPWLSRLANLDTGLTPGPVGTAVAQAQAKLLPLGPFLTKAAAGTSALGGLLGADGPHTILLVLQNNAELRATGGLIGSFAIAHSDHGVLHVGRFRDADSIEIPAHISRRADHTVPAPPDYTRTYGPFLANTTLLKNANYSPNVPEVGRVLSEILAKRLGVRADAVMLFDAPAVASLVEGSGVSVHLPNQPPATGAQLVRELLVSAYAGVSPSAGAQLQRHYVIERAADDALKTALEKTPSYGFLRAFGQAVAGRHVTAWSADPQIERDLTRADAAGSLSLGNGVVAMASSNNMGDPPDQGNKLDYYAHRSVSIRAALSPTRATVQEIVTVRNAAPTGLGPYVEGPHHPGQLTELWSLLLPANADVIGLDLDGNAAKAQRDPIADQSQVILPVTTQRGATSTITLEYSVPLRGHTFRLTAVPQPLAVPAELSVRIGGAAGGVHLDHSVNVKQPFNSTTSFEVHVS